MRRAVYRSRAARGLASRAGVRDPRVAARLLASQVIADLPGPPFVLDSASVRSALGIREIRTVQNSSLDGRIFGTRDGFVVELHRRLSPERRAFTLAHELAHTFFAEPATEGRAGDAKRDASDAREEEALCDIAAAEMLMPAAALIRDRGFCSPAKLRQPLNAFFRVALEYPVSVDGVVALARAFRTSLAATARRITELALWSCHIGFWSIQEGVQVEFAGGYASNRELFVPAGTVLERGVLGQAVESASGVEGWDDIRLQTRASETCGEVLVQAVRLRGSNQLISVAVMRPDLRRQHRSSGMGVAHERASGQGRLFG